MSDNKYYEKIRKYARRALNSDLKTYIRGRDLYMYGTVDMSEYVRQTVFDDTVEELEGKILDLDDKKANKSDVYTKDETDDKFLTQEDASKTYQPIGDYAEKSDLDNYYTKNETDDKFLTKDEAAATYLPIGDYATVTYVDNADTLLLNQINLKQDQLTAGLGILIENNVISCTIDATLFKVVTSLPNKPDEGDENKIFLVPSELQGDLNIYIEYLYVNGAWEKIGELHTEVDLSDYYTKEEVATILENYYTKTEVDNLLKSKLDTLVAGSNITIVDNVISATGGITKITASGTSPLVLGASTSSDTAIITGSIDVATNDDLGVAKVKDENGLHIANDGEIYLTLVSTTENGAMSAEDKMRLNELWEYYQSIKGITYDIPVVELSYSNIPYGGGTSDPVISYSQRWYIDGIEQEPITSGGEVKYELVENFYPEMYSVVVDENTGRITASQGSMTSSLEFNLCNVKATITLNDKSGETTAIAKVDLKPIDPYTYDIKITDFGYPPHTYNYEAQTNISVLNLTVMLYTYDNGIVIATDDITDECNFDYYGNVDWITPSVSTVGLLPINIAENTTTESRTGTVHLKATYQDYTDEVDSIVIVQTGLTATYSLEISTFYYDTPIPAKGGIFSPTIEVLLITKTSTSSGRFVVTPESCKYSKDPTSDFVTIDSSTGIITVEENTSTNLRKFDAFVTAYYTAPDGTNLEADSMQLDITQEGSDSVITYSNPVIDSFTYPKMPANGGTINPTITYHQDWTDNQGNSGTITNTGAEFVYSFTVLNMKWTLDSSTGELSTTAVNDSEWDTIIGYISCVITMNDLESTSVRASIIQEGQTVTYSLDVLDFYYNNKNNIPASGGIYSPTLNINLVGSDGSSVPITIEEGDCGYLSDGDIIFNSIGWHTGVIDVKENTGTSVLSSTIYFDGDYVDPNGNDLTISASCNITQESDNPDSPETYHLAQGNLIINSEATGISAGDIEWENTTVNIYSNNYTGTGTEDTIRYKAMGDGSVAIGSFGQSIDLLPTSDDIELTKVAKLSMIGISFEDPTLNLDDKQIKYTFKWHYGEGKTFERSGNLYLQNKGMGDTGEWVTDDYDQSDANLYYSSDYEMYPEVTLTITD